MSFRPFPKAREQLSSAMASRCSSPPSTQPFMAMAIPHLSVHFNQSVSANSKAAFFLFLSTICVSRQKLASAPRQLQTELQAYKRCRMTSIRRLTAEIRCHNFALFVSLSARLQLILISAATVSHAVSLLTVHHRAAETRPHRMVFGA